MCRLCSESLFGNTRYKRQHSLFQIRPYQVYNMWICLEGILRKRNAKNKTFFCDKSAWHMKLIDTLLVQRIDLAVTGKVGFAC